MSSIRHYNEARRHRDDPMLDHREYLDSLDISEEAYAMIIEQLEPTEGIISTALSQNCRGIYSHYLNYLKSQYGSNVSSSIDMNIKDTRKRMGLHQEKTNRAGYGLVMGRIQSGKTAHMIGISLHSIDPEKSEKPYDLVIILAGLIEDLRIQTMHRYSEAIEGFQGISPIILPEDNSDISSTDEEMKNQLSSSISNLENRRMALIIKKNHTVLKTLYGILQNCPIPRKRVLIIDDESDYASTDTGELEVGFDTGEHFEDQPSETNRILRKLIQHFNSASSDCMYLGYTATPFANLLATESLHPLNSEFGLSLFPRDFIHSLKGSDTHLDNQHYFAQPNCQAVLTIDSFDGELAQERKLIEEVIYRHIITELVKKYRGFNSHHTTLIHTSREVEDHRRIAEIVREMKENMQLISQMGRVCDDLLEVTNDYNLDFGNLNHCKSEIERMRNNRRYYLFIFSDISIIEVNSRKRDLDEISERNLRYRYGRRSYIAIGGTRLSRGLTLEGLTTSLFVRSPQVPRYDTMMQMSRWCGYRENNSGDTYADLVKIVTTLEIAENFRNIALAEYDLRRKIENIPWDETPLEQPGGLWIIETPNMAVTSDEKMQYVRRRSWGRMGTLPIWSYKCPVLDVQTPETIAHDMYQKARILIEDISAFGTSEPPSGASNFRLVQGVPSDWVFEYLEHYREMYGVDDNSKTVQNLDRLINLEYRENTDWTIAIHTPNRPKKTHIAEMEIGLVNRSKRNNQEIMVISNRAADTSIDVGNYGERINPLLLIYFIDPDSTQGDRGVERVFDRSVSHPIPVWGVCMPQPTIEEGGSEVRGGL